MSDRMMMYCPTCRNMGQMIHNPVLSTIELMRDMGETTCANGHKFGDYQALMAMNPDKIKLIPHETPQPNDVKLEVWVDKKIWDQFNELYPYQKNATVQSIMSLHLTGAPIIIDGVQAEKLKKLGVRNGQEMVAAVEVAKTLEAQISTLESQIANYAALFQAAGVQAPA